MSELDLNVEKTLEDAVKQHLSGTMASRDELAYSVGTGEATLITPRIEIEVGQMAAVRPLDMVGSRQEYTKFSLALEVGVVTDFSLGTGRTDHHKYVHEVRVAMGREVEGIEDILTKHQIYEIIQTNSSREMMGDLYATITQYDVQIACIITTTE